MADYPEPLQWMSMSRWLQSALGVNAFIGDVLTCFLVILPFLLEMAFLKTSNYVLIVMSVLLMTVLTASGFLPFYTWVVLGIYLSMKIATGLRGGF
jgi:hypothetical protein